MKLAVRSAAAAVAAVTTAGVSTLALGVAPAAAVPSDGCGASGDLVAPGVCEQIFTSAGTFTPTAQMTKLEILLVGGGGTGNNAPASGTNGYASAGGGGEVVILDRTGSASAITITPGGAGSPTTLAGGATGSANAGDFGDYAGTTANGGDSGSGETGASMTADPAYAGGAGDGGAASGANGGAGTVVGSIAPGGSLFTGDTRCYGGGGAAGLTGVQGLPGCGGSGPVDATDGAVTAVVANSGGGGGATTTADSLGAAGVAIVRWNAGTVTLSFSANGHGTAPAAQSVVAGTAATRPADPTADGFEFLGWYTDASLATLADFSAGVNNSTTYVAGWRAALPATGSEPSPIAFGSALAALLAGTVLVAAAARRRAAED